MKNTLIEPLRALREYEELRERMRKTEGVLSLTGCVEAQKAPYFKNYFTVYFKKANELPVESYQDLVDLKGVVRKEEMIYPMIYQRLPRGMKRAEIRGR